jgi:hypothetical protein
VLGEHLVVVLARAAGGGFDQPLAGGPALDGDREAILNDWGVWVP